MRGPLSESDCSSMVAFLSLPNEYLARRCVGCMPSVYTLKFLKYLVFHPLLLGFVLGSILNFGEEVEFCLLIF